MKAPARTTQEIALDAHDYLGGAQIVLSKLESLLYAALAEKTMSPHARNLIDIGWNLACEAASTTASDYEAIGNALKSCAPQNTESKNIVRDSEVPK